MMTAAEQVGRQPGEAAEVSLELTVAGDLL